MNRLRKTIEFGKLRRVLESFGYRAQGVDDGRIVFVHPERRLLIVLPDVPPEDVVRPIDLISVRNTLINDGVLEGVEEFDALFHVKKGDRLIWTIPRTKQEVRVTAASGETSDGLVMIEHPGGTFSPCPIDQLREDEAVAGRHL